MRKIKIKNDCKLNIKCLNKIIKKYKKMLSILRKVPKYSNDKNN